MTNNIKEKKIGKIWKIQKLIFEIRILDFKHQLVYSLIMDENNKGNENSIYNYIKSVHNLKIVLKNPKITIRNMN